MLLNDALKLVNKQIETGETHQDYARTKELAETYKIYITGKNIEKKLIQFVQREDAALFAQRLAITKSTTPAVASSIRQPFNKVVRNDRIKKDIKIGNDNRKPVVQEMISRFYGSKRKKNRGLDYWLKTRFLELQFIDPNAWVVVEWDAPKTLGEVIAPRPFEVKAENAVNFFVVNDEVKWLLVKQPIKYLSTQPAATGGTGTANAMVPTGAGKPADKTKKDGHRWTLYDEDVTVVYEQIDPDAYELQPGEKLEKIKDLNYVVRNYAPNVGYVPAFRIGYKRDEETDGRTFVNPWHDSLCFFEKSLKTVSELDLTMTLHVFPQKLQYVQKCQGTPAQDGRTRKGCNMGVVQGTTNQICEACNGRGYKLHTTAQDAILLPMPTDPKNEDIIDLEKLIAYKTPPIELIKFQNEYTQQLERQAHQGVFNSQVFVKKSGGGITEQQTATEADYNMQSVYDTLEPFTEKYSETWREFVTIFAVIAGESLDKIDILHEFPADYKLKTGDILLEERKGAKESGAPAFLIETIDDDLAEIIYQGDPLGLQKYQVKRRFYPFTGKTEDEVAMLLTSEFVPKAPKVLYSNFELIFKELETEAPEFWVMKDYAKQREMVEKKTAEWVEKLDAEKAPAPVFNMFRGDAGTGEEETEGNPGEGQQGAAV